MARLPRYLLLSDFNHIIIRGIGHMDLFFKDGDYLHFLDTLQRFKTIDNVEIHCYCLMNNHVHLLLKADREKIPLYLKRIEVSYASYFNGTKEHCGHLFQNRYTSEPVTDSSYYLTVLRYILQNPQKAGICNWTQYRYSSAFSYLAGKSDGLTDPSTALKMFENRLEFCSFMDTDEESQPDHPYEFNNKNRHISLTDEDAVDIIRRICKTGSSLDLQIMDKFDRNSLLSKLKTEGLSVRQIERLTGINRNMVQRA